MTELQRMFCDNLKRLREERNLSQGKLAALIGMDQARLSKIENGKVEPGLLTIEKLAIGLKVSASMLFLDYTTKDTVLARIQEIQNLPEKDRMLVIGVLSRILEKEKLERLLQLRTSNRLKEINKSRGIN